MSPPRCHRQPEYSFKVSRANLALCVQTPKVGDVPLGGIGSSALFLEDSGLGPEPVLPTRYGNGIDNKVLPAALFVLSWYLSLAPSRIASQMCKDDHV